MSEESGGHSDPRSRLLLSADSPLNQSTRDLEDTALAPKAASRLKRHGFSDIRSLSGVSERDLLDLRQFGPRLVDVIVEGLALEEGRAQESELPQSDTDPSLHRLAIEFAAMREGERLKVVDFQRGVSEAAGFDISQHRVRVLLQRLLDDETVPLILIVKGIFCWSPSGEIPPPAPSPRDARVIQRRREGRTLADIGQEFGVTRERVRQILNKYGGPTPGEIRASRHRDQEEREIAMTEKLRVVLLQTGPQSGEELAERTNVDVGTVQRLWPPELRYLRTWEYNKAEYQVWSDEECLEALRSAALYEFPLTTTAYAELVRIGQVRGPSVPGLSLRFGSWTAACVAAGVEHGEPRAFYESRWSDQDLLGFARKYFLDPRFTGSVSRYDDWKRENEPDGPSQQTLRNRLGSWSDIKRMALKDLGGGR